MTAAPGVGRVPSERLLLAELVSRAVLAVDGVAGLEAGPTGLVATVQAGRRVEGVLCAANNSGGYDLFLRLIARPVALHPLAERVRARAARATAAAGLPVGRVDVHVADVAALPASAPGLLGSYPVGAPPPVLG